MTEQERWLMGLMQEALMPTPMQEDRLLARLREVVEETSRDEVLLWQSFARLMTSLGDATRQAIDRATQTPGMVFAWSPQ